MPWPQNAAHCYLHRSLLPLPQPPTQPGAPTPAGELKRVGLKNPENIAKVSVRNDAAFLISVVGTTSIAAVVLGQLPGAQE